MTEQKPASQADSFVVVGTGYVGARVLQALEGRSRVGFYRSEMPRIEADCRRLDLDDPDTGRIALPANSRVLYTVPPPREGENDPRMLRFLDRVEGRPSRFVYLSTTGVYGDRGGEVAIETDPPAPQTPRAKRRLAAETAIASWCDRRRVDCYRLRVPGIYGPGRLGLERLRDGAEILRDEDSGPGNRIQVDDLVRCCVAALTGTAPPGIYNVGDGDHRSSTDFSVAVAQRAGLPAPEKIPLSEARRRWPRMRLSFVQESRRADTTKMRDVLGVTPEYASLEDGIAASLAAAERDPG
ncbi:MAG: NAD-dependent epimerase/dehydratase family protein [Woeseiaceae bacterium]|nr:NAD-dependent epimerase/dehydratase family protein [Woeseiaceae bacterium]